ncbi:MAG: histidinol-phosphate transaminase [bacterium]
MELIERLVSPEIRALSAYHVPPAKGMVKLDAMENPYSLPEALRQEWLTKLGQVEINRYPDSGACELKSKLREVFDIPDNLGLILGNGSDELIQMVASLVGGPGRMFLTPSPSFSMYEIISLTTSTGFKSVSLNNDFSPNRSEFLKELENTNPACIFIAYPNNPTGNSFDRIFIEEIISTAPGLVVIDEAYFSFSGKSFLQQIDQFSHVLVMRTLSKSGLAGLRLGMMMGHPEWIEQLEKIRLPYNINCLTQASVEFCLDHFSIFSDQAAQIITDRMWLAEHLQKLTGLTVFPSETNFILVRLDRDADQVFESLKHQGILVKNLHRPDTLLENCLRVTVGTPQQNLKLVNELGHCLR